MNGELEVIYQPIEALERYKDNSRTHSDTQVAQIQASMQEFGFTNPILVDEEMGIIAGHGRLEAAIAEDYEVVPVIILNGLSDDQKRAYVIADNKMALNAGWNDKMLTRELGRLADAAFDLSLTGFSPEELSKYLEIDGEESEEGTVEFSEEIGEVHNYVVLYFDNEMDWLSAQTHFNLKSVHSKRQNGKPWSKGVGRVVRGGEYLSRLKGENV